MPTPTWDNLDAPKRERILDAAMEEFGRRGFSAGSLNVVAREAGIAKGSLFQYFEDKRELFAHVCDVCSQRIRDDFLVTLSRHATEQDDLFDFVRAVLMDWVRYFREHPRERAITFAISFEIDPQARRAVRAVTNRHYLEVLESLVDEAADRGDLRTRTSREHLLAYLLLLLPHLATAPSSPELDPVLGLADLEGDALTQAVHGFVDVLAAAFSSRAPTAAGDPQRS